MFIRSSQDTDRCTIIVMHKNNHNNNNVVFSKMLRVNKRMFGNSRGVVHRRKHRRNTLNPQ